MTSLHTGENTHKRLDRGHVVHATGGVVKVGPYELQKQCTSHIGRQIVWSGSGGRAFSRSAQAGPVGIVHVHVNVRRACLATVFGQHPPGALTRRSNSAPTSQRDEKGGTDGPRYNLKTLAKSHVCRKQTHAAVPSSSCCTDLGQESHHARQEERASPLSPVVVNSPQIPDSNSNSAPPAGVGRARRCRPN